MFSVIAKVKPIFDGYYKCTLYLSTSALQKMPIEIHFLTDASSIIYSSTEKKVLSFFPPSYFNTRRVAVTICWCPSWDHLNVAFKQVRVEV